MQLGNHPIGPEHPPFVIAEIGSNHDGSLDNARRYIEACAKAGADAVKFQLFRPETLVNPEVPDGANWVPHPAWDLLGGLAVPKSWLADLTACCRDNGVLFTCTPFDEEAVAVLDGLDIPFYKVASGELTHRRFLETVGATGRPVVLSTGMGTLDEVRDALGWLRAAGSGAVALLHCVSNYPPRDGDMNLAAIGTLAALGPEAIGFSDHGPGSALPCAAVHAGARIIEKHVTFDRALDGPDHPFALTIEELQQLATDCRRVFEALGGGDKQPVEAEADMRIHARRGLWAVRDLKAGDVVGPEDIAIVRPCLPGQAPAEAVHDIVGSTLQTDISARRPIPES